MEKNGYKLINVLYQKNLKCSLKQLAKELDVSENTVHSLISNNRQGFLDNGMNVEIGFINCTLEIVNDDKFYHFIMENSSNKDERLNRFLMKIINADDYLKIEDIASEMYVSRATLDRLVPIVKMICKEYHLTFESKPKYGIRISGSEANKRLCIANYSSESYSLPDCANEALMVQNIVLDTIKKYDLQFCDINFYNLIQHIMIMINRIQTGNIIVDKPEIDEEISYENELKAADEIVERLEDSFQISINEAEKYYLLIHLLGKRAFSNVNLIDDEVLECVDGILNYINQQKGLDLHNDVELTTSLTLHIKPLLTRLKYGLKQENPYLEQVKREMSNGFELATVCNDWFIKNYQLTMSDAELSYLAIYFSMALQRRKEQKKNKKIVIICATGRGTAKLIQYKLTQRYHYRSEDIILASLFQLDTLDLSDVQCIMSSLPLSKNYQVPVFYFGANIDDSFDELNEYLNNANSDVSFINQNLLFENVNCSNREEVLKFICEKIYLETGVDLYREVLKREQLSSTEVGKLLAIPHPFTYEQQQPIVAIVSLKYEIKWKFNKVKYVILTALPENQPISATISDKITKIVTTEDLLDDLMNDLSLENVQRIFG